MAGYLRKTKAKPMERPPKVYELFRDVTPDSLHPRYDGDPPKTGERDIDNFFRNISERQANHILNLGVGIEIEVENAVIPRGSNWVADRDNSLRGENAFEFKTPFGTRMLEAYEMLSELEDTARKNPKKFSFSDRTSVHIHVDCRNMTMKNVESFVQLYLLFENTLFRFAGPQRLHNIFCIPVRKSSIIDYSGPDMMSYLRNWEKYSALNLRCLRDFGTIEFRHMAGNVDANHIFRWMLMIGCIHYAAMRWKSGEVVKEIFNLKAEKVYTRLADKLFSALTDNLVIDPADMDHAASEAKLFIFGDK